MKIEVLENINPDENLNKNPGKVIIVKVSGALWDLKDTDDFKKKMSEVIEENPVGLIFDFRELTRIDSFGINVIVNAREKLKKQGKKMAIATQSRGLKNLFAINQIDQIIPIYDSVVMAVVGVQN